MEHYFVAGNIFVQQQTDLLHGTHTFNSLNVRVLFYGSASDDSEELFSHANTLLKKRSISEKF